jgi:hypothetical protein
MTAKELRLARRPISRSSDGQCSGKWNVPTLR